MLVSELFHTRQSLMRTQSQSIKNHSVLQCEYIWMCLLRNGRFSFPRLQLRDIRVIDAYIRRTVYGIGARRTPHSNIPYQSPSPWEKTLLQFINLSTHESAEPNQACTHTTYQLICLYRRRNRLLIITTIQDTFWSLDSTARYF